MVTTTLKTTFPTEVKAWRVALDYKNELLLLKKLYQGYVKDRSPLALSEKEDPIKPDFRHMYTSFMNTYGNFVVALGRYPKQVRLMMIGNESMHVKLQ